MKRTYTTDSVSSLLASLARVKAKLDKLDNQKTLAKLHDQILLNERLNSIMPFFAPFAGMIIRNRRAGVSLASIARAIHKMDSSRYGSAQALYQALYRWYGMLKH